MVSRTSIGILVFYIFLVLNIRAEEFRAHDLDIILPDVIVSDVKQAITIKIVSPESFGQFENVSKELMLNGKWHTVTFVQNQAVILHDFPAKETLSMSIDDFQWKMEISPIPLWMSVLPPLVAIMIALLLREVFTALFAGILVGTSIIYYYKGFSVFVAIGKGLLAIIDTYVMESLLDQGHMSIIIFSMVIGGMVHLITKNGGMKGVVNKLSRYATSARSGQLVTWALGVAIFFDDYANTLVVGNTMRPVTDRLKISREKLAYLVDSTAAPVAAIAFVTTWIGAELSYIQDGIATLGLQLSAYTVFFNSLAYSFYPILPLVVMLIIIIRKVEFGPMLKAERKARFSVVQSPESSEIQFTDGSAGMEMLVTEKQAKAFNAIIPVMIIILGTIAGLLYTGWDKSVWEDQTLGFFNKISTIIGKADSYSALLWSSLTAMLVSVMLTLGQRLLSLKDTINSLVDGFRTMLTAILILTLAWSVAMVTDHMHTADFISAALLKLSFSPYLIPAFTFILAALVAFSTGSSWGTMAILYPLILPASWLLTQNHGLDHEHSLIIFYNVVSSVLAGSVLGDHCSPISDTTILSSLASQCNHIEHVRTQFPYALTVGMVSVAGGTIPAAYGVSSWILFPLTTLALVVLVWIFGKSPEKQKA